MTRKRDLCTLGSCWQEDKGEAKTGSIECGIVDEFSTDSAFLTELAVNRRCYEWLLRWVPELTN